ncbi:tetratricopeptide repeat protein [Winogradskyella wichelsiae]|uniref:tetratricopeptide repeat protein n=1 Tax=Winogradskyella wichelsiae TaxID=2697007 RepID=UPI0015CD3D7B|nr:tetratricopeptide repeat protein [Winogradskyella wichelsiae]
MLHNNRIKIIIIGLFVLFPVIIFIILNNEGDRAFFSLIKEDDTKLEFQEKNEDDCQKYIGYDVGVINNLAIDEWELRNYELALSIGKCAYRRALLEKNRIEFANTLNILGLIYWRLENNKDAMEAYSESSKLANELSLHKLLGLTYTNQALILKEQGQYTKALLFNEKAIDIFNKNKLYRELGISYNNHGQIYKNQGQINEAEQNYFKAISSYEKQKYKDGLAATFYNLADIYAKKNNENDALRYGYLSLKIAKEIDSDVRVKDAYHKMSEIYERLNRLDSAIFYFKKFNDLNNKILITNQSKILANSQAEMSAEIKDLKIHNLEKNKELIQNRIIIISISLYIVLLLGLLFILKYTSKIELKNKEVTLKLKASNEILDIKEQELKSYILDLTKKSEVISNLQNVINNSNSRVSKKNIEIKKLSKKKILTSQDWIIFKEKFQTIYPVFFAYINENKIQFTEGEIRLMVLLKLKITSTEMGGVLGISPQSVRVSKMRLKKKLISHNFDSIENFFSFVSNV